MKNLILFLFAFLTLCFVSCEDEKTARVEVWLTDDPAEFAEVNIDLQAVEIHSSETDQEKGWQSLDVTPRIYDLLKLTNGTETLLGALELPGGRLSQVRLKLGDNNTVKIGDETYDLATPSAQMSGLKVQLHEVLTEGITYKIVLDFDAAKSVTRMGNGTYSLKPVIRAVSEAQGGSIRGTVEPAAAVSIALMSGDETISTTSTDGDGKFLIRSVQPGTYKLVFDGPGEEAPTEKTDVKVETGVVTDLGVIVIAQ